LGSCNPSTCVYDLRKSSWLEVSLSPGDTRKRVYRLKNPQEAIKEMAK